MLALVFVVLAAVEFEAVLPLLNTSVVALRTDGSSAAGLLQSADASVIVLELADGPKATIALVELVSVTAAASAGGATAPAPDPSPMNEPSPATPPQAPPIEENDSAAARDRALLKWREGAERRKLAALKTTVEERAALVLLESAGAAGGFLAGGIVVFLAMQALIPPSPPGGLLGDTTDISALLGGGLAGTITAPIGALIVIGLEEKPSLAKWIAVPAASVGGALLGVIAGGVLRQGSYEAWVAGAGIGAVFGTALASALTTGE